MKKALFILLILFYTLSANAQIGIIGEVIKSKRESNDKKRREEAIRKKEEQIRVEDSVRYESIKRSKIYSDSVDAVRKAEKFKRDSIQMVITKRHEDSIYNAIQKEANKKVWEKLNIDSIRFKEIYGSEFEYRIQNGQMQQSRNGWRVYFIGAKASYLNYILIYLSNNKGWSVTEPKLTGNSYVARAEIYNNKFDYKAKIYVSATLDANSRTKSVTITGTPNDIIDLFLDYWEDYDISISDLKSKKSIFIMRGSDKVSYSWTGKYPVITITKGNIDFQFSNQK